MAVLPQATPLLLTKRLNAFLAANQTPQLPTLLLTTSHGKLLAHASSASQPVAVLRTHATVAASLLAIHTSSSVALPSALPGASTPDPVRSGASSVRDQGDDEDDEDDEATARGTDDEVDQQGSSQQGKNGAGGVAGNSVKPVTITVQLSGGTVIIRRLKCGLLFVCVGPSAHDGASATSSNAAGPTASSSTAAAAAGSSGAGASSSSLGAGVAAVTQALESADLLSATVAETESLTSAGGLTTTSADSSASTSVVAMRRHAAELARWLDDKLGTLSVPEDSTGAER